MRRATFRMRHVLVLALALTAWTSRADGQPTRRSTPHAGYVYPAGGQVGTKFTVTVGGQFLRNPKEIRVTGGGVRASIGLYLAPARPLDRPVAQLLRRRLAELRAKKLGTPQAARDAARAKRNVPRPKRDSDKPAEAAKLPDHPLLKDLGSKTVEELGEVARYFFGRRNPLQRKRAIEELVKVEVTIGADAEPGMRELRIRSQAGWTNPLRFRVGLLPEVRESGLDDLIAWVPQPRLIAQRRESAIELPAVLNGQILPRDADRFRLRAKKGQRLVARAEARTLIPYQADSVPGWMQTTLALFDATGKEVAFADEYRFDPDPVLFYEVPEDGEYVLEVRDAIARGREDFVYRVEVGALPFVTSVFPLGGRSGKTVNAKVEGWNLPRRSVKLDASPNGRDIRETAWRIKGAMTNTVRYAIDSLPEAREREPNDGASDAGKLDMPRIVNGRIARPGDRDVFRVEGCAGDEIVAEVVARALGSPLDSLVRLLDKSGRVIAWNDDGVPEDAAGKGVGMRGLGLSTHDADSHLRARLPKDGVYFVQVTDARGHGGDDHAYRLRVGPPRPSVDLFVTPSSLSVAPGRAGIVTVFAVRKDGFDGDIKVELDGAEGFALGGARIPRGRDRMRMTLTTPRQAPQGPIDLKLRGRLLADGAEIVRPVVPADDVMQAFLWRHLVPAKELAVTLVGAGGRWVPIVKLAEKGRVRLAAGSKARARFTVNGRFQPGGFQFALVDPPAGVTLGPAKATDRGFALTLQVAADAKPGSAPSGIRAGVADNLIVEVFTKPNAGKNAKKGPQGKAARKKRPFSLGYLPAIPIAIEARVAGSARVSGLAVGSK